MSDIEDSVRSQDEPCIVETWLEEVVEEQEENGKEEGNVEEDQDKWDEEDEQKALYLIGL
jgi:hypothetical protein